MSGDGKGGDERKKCKEDDKSLVACIVMDVSAQ